MRLSLKPLLVGALCCCLGGVACDRVSELKDKLLGSSTSGKDVNPELEAVRSLYESRDYEGALRRIASMTESDPNLAEAYYYRGLCYLAKAGETGSIDASAPLSPDEESSLEAFRRALSINPRHAPSNVGLGDLYSRRVPARRRGGNSEDPEDPYVLAITAYRQAVMLYAIGPCSYYNPYFSVVRFHREIRLIVMESVWKIVKKILLLDRLIFRS